MRQLSSLLGLQVISTSEGKKLGTIAEAYVDLAAGEIVCVTLAKTPELRVILAEDIDVIGDDAVMVSDGEKLHGREDVEEELERGKRVLSKPPTVITSQGKTLGELGAIQIDEATKKVIRFEVTRGTLEDVTEGVLALPVLEGIVHGEDTLIVPHEVVARRLVQSGGLRGALRNLGERLKGGVEELSEKSGEFARESEKKLKERADEARKKAAEATEKAREAVGEAADEAREKLDEVADDAKEVIEGEEEAEAPEAPEDEPDAPRIEDEVAEAEAAEEEVHLVPEAATPLPAGDDEEEGSASEKQEASDDATSEDEPSDDESGEENE